MSDAINSPVPTEEFELPEPASEQDLAVSERLLAALLVRLWRNGRQPQPVEKTPGIELIPDTRHGSL